VSEDEIAVLKEHNKTLRAESSLTFNTLKDMLQKIERFNEYLLQLADNMEEMEKIRQELVDTLTIAMK
jgi:hypothetical protein